MYFTLAAGRGFRKAGGVGSLPFGDRRAFLVERQRAELREAVELLLKLLLEFP